jgi:hypothetical protein
LISPQRILAQTSSHADQILHIHKELLASHLENDAGGVLDAEADTIVVVGRGEVSLVVKEQREQQFKKYLEHVKFKQYEDLIPPIVHVSEDGTMGWLIARVRIVGEDISDKNKPVAFESIWAWIELYERHGERWVRVGEVSNLKPSSPQNSEN